MSDINKRKETQEDVGEKILLHAIYIADKLFNSRLIACYALGSLAHGGFSSLVSDVDLGIIIDDLIAKEDAEKIDLIKQHVVKEVTLPLAKRLSIFWGSPYSIQNTVELGRFPASDKFDLIENGRILCGVDIRSTLKTPTYIELISTGAAFALQQHGRSEKIEEILQPHLIFKKGVRHLTKTALLPVRLLYTLHTGKIGSNDQAITYYLTNKHGSKVSLVKCASDWRYKAPENSNEVVKLMEKAIIPLYLQFINAYYKKLIEHHEFLLANNLIMWKQKLLTDAS